MTACHDNETTILVEHIKAPAEAPSCSYTVGDGFTSQVGIDLAFGNHFEGAFLLRNQMMSRENYDNAVAESSGIVIEGMELFVQDASSGAGLGSTEYFEREMYLPPEAQSLSIGVVMSMNVVSELISQHRCLELTRANYPHTTIGVDANGRVAGRGLGYVYSQVRFLGHTNGDLLVETPEFTVPIALCCGCMVNWANCVDPCERYCGDPKDHGMCTPGVFNGGDPADCRWLYIGMHPPDYDGENYCKDICES